MNRAVEFKVRDECCKCRLENHTVWRYGNVSTSGSRVSNADAELCQFTGLLDKNGQKIFEGDIVELKSNMDESKKVGVSKVLTILPPEGMMI